MPCDVACAHLDFIGSFLIDGPIENHSDKHETETDEHVICHEHDGDDGACSREDVQSTLSDSSESSLGDDEFYTDNLDSGTSPALPLLDLHHAFFSSNVEMLKLALDYLTRPSSSLPVIPVYSRRIIEYVYCLCHVVRRFFVVNLLDIKVDNMSDRYLKWIFA